ncbi:2-amino-4-hydroxy-6-hydroxymethyldihydropteridine diphosphokinase [Henriciella barbarensis]|uniref:2-amino-4-hydroxy-6-hydroxymethyldihydropteridine pyrophosphokinase n=1 Tax=Henriciella barbarensis TaxID=86342 RepID=A0A399QZJ0_9PROT|nr:2-amino-4-hydroxy-6-hydroxymethyldihydropteridine diphosphokinase [Henriciella barbarensis]RIJ24143.1 2-amino-4-hydroxy-6-hydroxymethyldihydropteridine diphosphokinase [Henriciella barbarensis]
MTSAALAFGSNLGDSAGMIGRAIEALDAMTGVSVTARSSLYATPPWGVEDQPDFVNACALVETGLAPLELLIACKDLEAALGRMPGERWGPRFIDIDVLWMDGVSVESERLTLPHPRMTERAFVLVPLTEIAPELIVGGRAVADWVSSVEAGGIRKLTD